MSSDLPTAVKTISERLDSLATRSVGNYKSAVQVFAKRDAAGAADVIETAGEISADVVALEEQITTALALYQPVASDLRTIMRCFKLSHDFEKIASLAARIAKKTRKLCQVGDVAIPEDFHTNMTKVLWLTDACHQMTHEMDLELAEQIQMKNAELHQFKSAIKRQLEEEIAKQPQNAKALMGLLGISRNIVRIADVTRDVATELQADR